MNKKEIADALNGMEYPVRGSDEIFDEAEENDIVIVMGSSDDLIDFYGAISDEGGVWEGKTVYVNKGGLIDRPECDCENAEKWYEQEKKAAKEIKALWCPTVNGIEVSWAYETDIPHETFQIVEDDGVYCIGIVFDRKDLE